MKLASALSTAIILTLVGETLLGESLAKVKLQVKSLRDATHIELTGLNEWRYDVRRKTGAEVNEVAVQISGVSPQSLMGLEKIQDRRVTKVEVKAGTNGDAMVTFTLADKKINLFDYQTEAPSNLILDIYKDEPATPLAKTVASEKGEKASVIDSLVTKKKTSLAKGGAKNAAKKAARSIASVDHFELGTQPLLAANSATKAGAETDQLNLKYGIFDGGDQDLKRFKIDDSQVSEMAEIRSEQNIYLHFPALNNEKPLLKEVLASAPKIEVDKLQNEENEEVRLIIKLATEEKYAVALRTMKFFNEKFPKSNYQKTIDQVTADIYFKLWQRDHNRADFETAISHYKEFLNHYPDDADRFRLVMLIGLSYLDVGNYMGALSTFQVGLRSYPDSPYYWQMRLSAAQALNSLNKEKDAAAEFTAIEADPKSAVSGADVEARFRRGDVYFHAGDYAEAAKEYKAAITRYPDKLTEGPNLFFNSGEAEFWKKDYKASINMFREFLQRFPAHPYGGYAMTRIGEILEITGAPQRKYNGAYLESYFRYRGSPGAFIAKLHVDTARSAQMKEKEVEAFRSEVEEQGPALKLPDMNDFISLNEADSDCARKNFSRCLSTLAKFYQENPLSPHLKIFKERITSTLTAEIAQGNDKADYISALGIYIKNSSSWLSQNGRVDTAFFVARAYEELNVPDEANKYYTEALKALTSLNAEQVKRAKIFQTLPTVDEINLRLAKVSLKGDDVKKTASYVAEVKNPALLTEAERVEHSLILSAVAEKEEKSDLAVLALKELNDHWKGSQDLLVEAWLRIARINRDLKNYKEALPWANKVIELARSPNSKVSHEIFRQGLELAGDLNTQSGKIEEAQQAYKLYLDKFADGTPSAPVKYKLGKLYFDQKNVPEASKVWATLKEETEGQLWLKMADEQLAQAKWGQKYNRYLDRQPAGGTN